MLRKVTHAPLIHIKYKQNVMCYVSINAGKGQYYKEWLIMEYYKNWLRITFWCGKSAVVQKPIFHFGSSFSFWIDRRFSHGQNIRISRVVFSLLWYRKRPHKAVPTPKAFVTVRIFFQIWKQHKCIWKLFLRGYKLSSDHIETAFSGLAACKTLVSGEFWEFCNSIFSINRLIVTVNILLIL